MSRKFYIETHGCQMNEYDSARMADALCAEEQMVRTDSPEEADVLLLNTCSIREKAQEKVFSQLGRWRQLKQRRPDIRIGVGGCVASQEGGELLKRAPFVDMVFGPQTLHRLPTMLAASAAGAVVDVSFPQIEKFDRLPPPSVDGPTALLSIMEGCSKYCSFCVVPYTRGEEVSRPMRDILVEVEALARQGVREVTFLGQNVNAWRGQAEGGSADLAELLACAAQVEGIDRLRFTTSHPLEFDIALTRAYAELPELAGHLHLPVQSGSDAVLRAMKRGYGVDDYRERVRVLYRARPDISLSSDFIVGFPNETDEDFDLTLALVQEVFFDRSFSFIYSARPGTPAAELLSLVPPGVRSERLQRLQGVLNTQMQAISRSMRGSCQSVLVTDYARIDSQCLQGRTPNNRVVNFSARDPGLIGTFVQVRITEVLPNSLRGELVAREGGFDHLAPATVAVPRGALL